MKLVVYAERRAAANPHGDCPADLSLSMATLITSVQEEDSRKLLNFDVFAIREKTDD